MFFVDYDAIGEPYYYRVKIDGDVETGMYGSFAFNNVTDYYPPDPDDDSEINDGVLPAFYGRMGNDSYYKLLKQVKGVCMHWETEQRLKKAGMSEEEAKMHAPIINKI